MVNSNELTAAFRSTPLPGTSCPIPIGFADVLSPSSFKDVDINKKQGLITAYLTVYNNDDGSPYVDPYQDIIDPGSFTKTIQELDSSRNRKHNPWLAPDLWQHDRNELIGGIKELTEDSRGVIYVAQLAMGVRRAQEAMELAEQKMLGSSYGYDPIRFDILPSNIRKLKEVRLREASQVTFPANDLANILDTKQRWSISHVPERTEKLVLTKTDFTSLWNVKRGEEIVEEYDEMCLVLQDALLKTVEEVGEREAPEAVNIVLGQFQTKLQSWLPAFLSVRGSLDKSARDMLPVKAGRVMSQDTHAQMSTHLGTIKQGCNGLGKMLDHMAPGDASPKNDYGSTQLDTQDLAPGYTVPQVAPFTAPVPEDTEVSLSDFKAAIQGLFKEQFSGFNDN